jgi:hypothetical protein
MSHDRRRSSGGETIGVLVRCRWNRRDFDRGGIGIVSCGDGLNPGGK